MTKDIIQSSNYTKNGFREDYYMRCEDDGTILQYYTIRYEITNEEYELHKDNPYVVYDQSED